ncbi:hypothetical protein K2173_028287 [Erythroxylum novogranatense]|uniref:Endonuclease/exonuclease/phosphatase domain-containing protein n=1 Tax=Erythroxylum novogranatense TaxID=1862640 RepID=A0AAV8U1K2_9ROSI|nr:hypothetical protein K2173_028287 [Erythroxylum novogranatense]
MDCCSGSGSFRLFPAAITVKPSSLNRRPSLVFLSNSSSSKTTANATVFSSTDSSSSSLSSDLNNRRRHNSSQIVRHWVDAYQPLASHERFKVVSYNILGNRNALKHRDLYQNVPSSYLKWCYRKRIICDEIIGWDPDIICLQEVDRYFDLFKVLKKAGYGGCYKRRTGDHVDGCAMLWKSDMQICNGESKRLLVGNIHVLYNPSRGDIKLGQIRFLLSRAQILSKKWGNIPVVLTGDFNSTPQSAIYNFLSSSELNVLLYEKKELSGQRNCRPAQVFDVNKETNNSLSMVDGLFKINWTGEEVKVATGSSEHHIAVHPLKLKSSYATIEGSTSTRDLNGEPLATSYHSKFLGTVDYLWYSGGIAPTGVLDTLPFDILRRTGGLPCEKLGSDHLALVSEFGFTEEGNTTFSGSA